MVKQNIHCDMRKNHYHSIIPSALFQKLQKNSEYFGVWTQIHVKVIEILKSTQEYFPKTLLTFHLYSQVRKKTPSSCFNRRKVVVVCKNTPSTQSFKAQFFRMIISVAEKLIHAYVPQMQ